MKIIQIILVIALVSLLIGCAGPEPPKNDTQNNTQVQQKDCGDSERIDDDNALCFQAEYMKCSPAKLHILPTSNGYEMNFEVTAGTPTACEFSLALLGVPESVYPDANGKLTCTVNTANGNEGMPDAVVEAHEEGKCAGAEGLYEFMFESSEPMATDG